MTLFRHMRKISFLFILAITITLSGCGSGAKIDEMRIVSSELNGFTIEVVMDSEDGNVYTSLYDETDMIIKGYEFDVETGSNTFSFNNLQNNGVYTVKVHQGNDTLRTIEVEVGAVLFTGISSEGEINTGLELINDEWVEKHEPIGLDRNSTNGEYITLNFDNPNGIEIKEVMFDGVIYSKSEFGAGSDNTKVLVKQMPTTEATSEVKRFNNYTITIEGEDTVVYPHNYNVVVVSTVKVEPTLVSIDTVVDIANRKGEASIAVYLDDNDDEAEIVAITVNGVRYDESDEEFTDEDRAMFTVDIEGSSGTETLNVESIEFDDLGGVREFDLTGHTTSFTMKIQDLGKGTKTSPIKIDSVEDLLRMGTTSVWSSKNTVYKLTTDIDFNDPASYEDPANFEIYSRLGSIARGWEPYGWDLEITEYHKFNATLDGNNKTIANLYIYKPGLFDAAFFAHIGEYGEVKNLYFEDAYVTGSIASVVASFNLGTIDKVAITNSNDPEKDLNTSIIHLVSNQDDSMVVGSAIAGYLESRYIIQDRCEDDPLTPYVNECLVGVRGTVKNSYSEATVVALNNIETEIEGTDEMLPSALERRAEEFGLPEGYFGSREGEEFRIEDANLGGLVGSNSGGIIEKCYTNSTVVADVLKSTYVGGIAYQNGSLIKEVYSVGYVEAKSKFASHVGGIVGLNLFGTLTMAYSSADVIGETELHFTNDNDIIDHLISIGGLVGYNHAGGVYQAISINQHIEVRSPRLGRQINFDYVAANRFIYNGKVNPWYAVGSNLMQYFYNTTMIVEDYVDAEGNDILVTPKDPQRTSVMDLMNEDWYIWDGNITRIVTEYSELMQRRVDWERTSWNYDVITDGYMPIFKSVINPDAQPLTKIDEDDFKLNQLGAIAIFEDQELNYTDEEKTEGTIEFDFSIILAEDTTSVTDITIEVFRIDSESGKIVSVVRDEDNNPLIIDEIEVEEGEIITITPDFTLIPRDDNGEVIKYAFVVKANVDGVQTEIGVKNWIEYYGVEYDED